MSKKILQIISTAYRATIEEQDDTIVWLTHTLKDLGSPVDVLLRRQAVNYGVAAQDASGLQIGGWQQTQPPQLAQDLSSLMAKGCRVYFVDEDAAYLGLERTDLLAGMIPVGTKQLPEIFAAYDHIWAW